MKMRAVHYCETVALFLLTACFFVSALSVSLTMITYLLAFIFMMMSDDWKTRWARIKNNRAALSFWLLGLLFVLGAFYSTSTLHYVFYDLKKHHWLYMTPFFIALLSNNIWRQRMLNAFLIAMIATLFFSYIQYIFHMRFSYYVHLLRPLQDMSCVFVDHIVQSVALNIAAFIIGYRLLFIKNSKKIQFLYGILYLLMAVNILLLSKSRTGYGIFFLLLTYLSISRFHWKGLLLSSIAFIFLVGSAFFISSNFRSHIMVIKNQYQHYDQLQTQTSVGQRIEMWHIAKTMIQERPWFGYGTGGIHTPMQTVIAPQDRKFNPNMNYVESIYLNMLLAFGLVGFSVFVVAIALQIKTSFQLPHEYRFLMHAVLISVLFGGLVNSFFASFSVAHLYALFSALCFSAVPCLRGV